MAKEYIERDVAIEKTETFCDVFVTNWTDEKVLAWIKNLPTADVVGVKHGRWKEVDYWSSNKDGNSIRYIANQCSACHCNSPRKAQYNYCPNCGAKMNGKPEEE